MALNLMEEHELQVFQNKMFRKIYRPKKGKVIYD
jgi:hypothetical protein